MDSVPQQISSELIVLSTRPRADGEALAHDLRDLPLCLVSLPASEPRLCAWTGALEKALTAPADLWFFPSRHAVAILSHLSAAQRRAVVAACPGPGTARALREQGVAEVIVPTMQHTSEALLALPTLQHMTGKRVLVLSAPGGRDAVAEVLRQRGADVETVMVYERHAVVPASEEIARLERASGAWLSVVTSGQGLQHLQRHLPPALWHKVQQATMVVPSPRVAELAQAAGVTQVACVAPPDNAAIGAYIRSAFDQLIMH